jgi:hypothetical protein
MTNPTEDRTRHLVAKAHTTWATFDPDGLTSTVLRTLLWEIDHPASGDQTPATYTAWLDKVEPREPDGQFTHPAFVAELKKQCEEIHGQH